MLTFSFFSCKKTDLTSVELQEVSLQPRSGIISALEISEWLEGLKDTWYDIVGVKRISSKLEPSIVAVFRKWRKNSETSELPEVNFIDAFRECDIVEKIYLKYDPHMYDGNQIFRGGF